MVLSRRRHHLKGGYSSSWIRPSTRVAIYLRDGLCCVYCLQDWSIDGLTIDHVVSRSAGGGNEHTNLITACMRCNALKRAAGGAIAFSRALDLDHGQLQARLAQQAQPLTMHLRRRAVHLLKFPPAWLRELKRLNENWTPQQALFPPQRTPVRPMITIEEPERVAGDGLNGIAYPSEESTDEIPF